MAIQVTADCCFACGACTGDEVTGGSGEGAYKLVGQPSIGAAEYLLVGGTGGWVRVPWCRVYEIGF